MITTPSLFWLPISGEALVFAFPDWVLEFFAASIVKPASHRGFLLGIEIDAFSTLYMLVAEE